MQARFYGRDLARLHQKRYEAFTLRAAPVLLRILRKHGIRSGRVVDLACGPGGWVRMLRREGYDVVGVDISPEMIRLARAAAPSAKFVCGSMTRVKLPPCDAVTALGEAFNYLLRPSAVRRVFRQVADTLRPGGVFVFDFLEPATRGKSFTRIHSIGESGLRLDSRVTEYPARRLVVREIGVFRGQQPLTREVHRQRAYAGSELTAWLRSMGFRVRLSRDPRLCRWKRHVAVVARKK
jgi:SAM-dependent methyltransferase